jgi:chromosome partitioning protein
MPAMSETCSVCGKGFDVQFRFQMEERDGGFAFFCSHECHRKAVSGEATGGATCHACQKRFYVELVSQVVRVRGELRHACSEDCRRQILA